ncbi:4-fold beta flower protein [Pseudomonas sp. 18175]|uniref:4-fold beta flower protein n=1 Tax=Pseudomonas sp. 18175 TaxID=3390056 RepID=UPI003D19FE8B
MSLDFYDRDRMPIAYTDDDEHLYSYCGRPVAYIHEGSIYSYPGHHLGCISDGVIRDNHGHIVLYTADSRGGCEKPYLLPPPQKVLKQMRYLKCRRRAKHEIPFRLSWWSKMPSQEFFS